MENDLSRKGKFMASWKPWPPVIFLGVVGIMVLFQTPLLAALVVGGLGAVMMAVVGRVGESKVPARIAATASEVTWIDRGGRQHVVPLSRIQGITEIPRLEESLVSYWNEKGVRQSISVGPKVAELLRKSLSFS